MRGNIRQVSVSSFHAERSVGLKQELQADRYISHKDYEDLDAPVACLERLWLMNTII